MVKQNTQAKSIRISHALQGMLPLATLFLLIEFFDELNYGVGNAALPAIRTDLGVSYVQVGLLLGVPGIVNMVIEPVLMLLGDTRHRKTIILAGGVVIALSLLAIATASSFWALLLAMVVGYPASGAFVTLSQATLMDHNPGRQPHMMARWTVFGSVGNLVGPLLLAGGFAMGLGWRWMFFALAGLCLLLVAITWARHIPSPVSLESASQPAGSLRPLLAGVWDGVRNPRLMRWLVLLPLSDLLLDVLTGYLPLYFTDVARFSVAQASLLMSVLMAAGLVSNLVLIPVLEKFPGRSVVRLSAGLAGVLYAAWLLAPWLWARIGLIILLKLASMGWYEVLQGEAFAAVPGRSGTVMAINSLVGVLAGGISFLVGWVASQAGLPAAMWILLLGPISLVLFVPKPQAQAAHPAEPAE